jgi:xanthine dehydrogenase YagR molybdenum-binding subunit
MEMNAPAGSNALDVDARGVVGEPLDRVDGRLKVTGGARYAYEVEQGPTTAYGYVVEASIGKGQIKSIDTDMAERAPGVILVLTHRNAPQKAQVIITWPTPCSQARRCSTTACQSRS